MSSKRRRFSGELKAKVALEALRGDRTLQEIASQHQVQPEPGKRLEAPGDGGSGRGILEGHRAAGPGP